MIDSVMQFANGQSISGTSAQNSTNVYDHGTAALLFAGESAHTEFVVELAAVGGTNPTMRAQFVGADDAALSSNVITIAETGVSAVLVTTARPAGVPYYSARLRPTLQTAAKRFYGFIFTQSGTSPTGTVNAHPVNAGQSNLLT